MQKIFLHSSRVILEGVIAQAKAMKSVGIKTSQIMECLAVQRGGYDNMPFTPKDLHNVLDSEKKLELETTDSEMALAYLCSQKERDLGSP